LLCFAGDRYNQDAEEQTERERRAREHHRDQ
jgi:hypothetical protein